jgi:hypothetical protein
MIDHYSRHAGYDPNAFPFGLKVASLVLSTFLVGIILFETASTAAAIFA